MDKLARRFMANGTTDGDDAAQQTADASRGSVLVVPSGKPLRV